MASGNHDIVNMEHDVELRDFTLTSLDTGLNSNQVIEARKLYGKNILEEHVESIWKKIWKSVTSPISILIEIAIVVSIIITDLLDVFILAFLLLLNTSVHILHAWKAEGIVHQLKSTLALNARVRRDGQVINILAEDLVPGDLICLSTGDVIPADSRVVGESGFLLVDQSTLTGESLAVEKRHLDILYSTTTIKRGEAWAQVITTGKNTNVGKTAELVSFTKVSKKYSHVLSNINNFILASDFVICFLIFTIALFRSISLATIIVFLIILTVASLPIALPAVLTVTLAVGARSLARKQAIVTRLASIEALASVNVLCTDKTGTLTLNHLSVHAPYVFQNNDSDIDQQVDSDSIVNVSDNSYMDNTPTSSNVHDLLLAAALASENHSDRSKLDPIDQAILEALDKFHVSSSELVQFETINFVPFDPVSKRAEAYVRNNVSNEEWIVTKGAPQVILALLELPDDNPFAKRYDAITCKFAKRGFRSLGVARRFSTSSPWQILGILALFDPPRHDSAKTLEDAKTLGLKIKMLTGDALAIAKETARRLGMGDNIYDTTHLSLDQTILPNTIESEQIDAADGFSQIFPEHKYNIVDALQRRGHVVAVSGDGQNDAAALKKADVGIAVSGAVDSARAASSIVFLKDGLGVIVDAIRISRQIFARMYGYAIYRIAHSLHILWFILFLFSIFSFMLETQLLILLAIFGDLAVLLIGFDNAASSPQPESWNLVQVFVISIVLSVVLTIGTLIWYILLTTMGLSHRVITSLLFLQVALTENHLIFSTRLRSHAFQKPWPSIWLFLTVIAVDIVATVFVIFGVVVPASVGYIWIIDTWIFSLGLFVILDMSKVITRMILDRPRTK